MVGRFSKQITKHFNLLNIKILKSMGAKDYQGVANFDTMV